MPDPNLSAVNGDIQFDLMNRALRAQLDLSIKSGKALVEEHRERMAYGLMAVGIHLIPHDNLLDNQVVVSRGVYEAAKRLCSDSSEKFKKGE